MIPGTFLYLVVGAEVVHQRRGKRAAASLDVGRRFLYHGGARIGIRVRRSGQAHAKAVTVLGGAYLALAGDTSRG